MEVTQVSWVHDCQDVSHVHVVWMPPGTGREVDLDNHPQYINTIVTTRDNKEGVKSCVQ